MSAAATAAAEARAVTNGFQGQLASLQQDMQSLQSKVSMHTDIYIHIFSAVLLLPYRWWTTISINQMG